MSSKKIFSHYLEVENSDGKRVRYTIYKEGKNIFITNEHGYEQLMHPSAKTIEDEIRIVFKAKVIRTIPMNEI